MIVRRFLLWARTASAQQRADGVRVLAEAYLGPDLALADKAEAETAFLSMVHDPAPLVRRAMAEVLAPAPQTPRSLVLALIAQGGEPAALMLRHSSRLTDEELVDEVAVGDDLAQRAVAERAEVSAGVAAALAEVGGREGVLSLAANLAADIPHVAFRRMIERFGDDGAVREALLAREDLPLDLRQGVAARLSESLSAFVTSCGWLTPERSARVTRDSTEKVAIDLAATGDRQELRALVGRLRETGRLTPALLLRSLVFAEPALAEAALAELAGLPAERAAALMHDRRGAGFPSLYRKAGLPAELQPAFVAAVAALHEIGFHGPGTVRARTTRRILERVITAIEGHGSDAGGLLALLRRFEADCAREEAQAIAETLADDAALMLVIDADPSLLLEGMDPSMRIAA